MRGILYAGFCAIVIVCASCQSGDKQNKGKIRILCTTSMLADGVRNICGDKAQIQALMGAGVDPHLYKPAIRDLDKITAADVIVYNGLHLEGKMVELLKKIARTKPVLALSDGLAEEDIIQTQDAGGAHDPHIWFDMMIWKKGLHYIEHQLGEIDTLYQEDYKKNFASYESKLDSTFLSLTEKWSSVALEKRVLITSHDAFSYYGRSFGVEVKALQGISTMAEFGLRDVTELVDFICLRNVPAVFIESSVSDKSLKAVVEGCESRGCKVKIGAGLYSDAMGSEGTPEATYIGMITYNTNVIIKGLLEQK